LANVKIWSYRLYQMAWSGLDLLYPPVCVGCQEIGSRWCDICQQKIRPIPEPLCEVCGLPISKNDKICSNCDSSRPSFCSLRSWAVFDGSVRKALHHLKYRRDFSLGDTLALPISEFAINLNWPIDVVVPIPLSRQRYKERGYNQSALIAYPLSIRTGWVYRSKALARARNTRTQVGLTAVERRQNVQDAFVADHKLAQGKNILLVDDVATTGSTLSSAADALITVGARSVYALTLARALPHHGLKIV
jgi:ComF family protein